MATPDYSRFKLPLRVHVDETVFSHPQNFVVTQKQDMARGNPTSIDDPAGAWMNQGIGGDMNTIDLTLKLRDAAGVEVSESEAIPLKIQLHYCKGVSSFDTAVIDEVNQATEEDKSGKMTGTRSILVVSGKPRSLLHLTSNGRGLVSIRILETSSLHERRKFCVEVMPDTDDSRIRNLFHKDCGGSFVPPEDEVKACWSSRLQSISTGVMVMSKINKTGKKDVASQVHQHFVGAAKLLKPKSSEKMDADALKKLFVQCEQVRTLLVRAAKMKNLKLDNIANNPAGTSATASSTRPTSTIPHRAQVGLQGGVKLNKGLSLLGQPATQVGGNGNGAAPAQPIMQKHQRNPSSLPDMDHPRVAKMPKFSSEQHVFGSAYLNGTSNDIKNEGNPQQSSYGLEVPEVLTSMGTFGQSQELRNGSYGEAVDHSLMLPGPYSDVGAEVFDITDDIFAEIFQNLQDDEKDFNIIGCNLSPEGLFFTLDLSQEGWLNVGEVEHALKVLRIPLSSQIAKAFMFACDKDKDGKISKDEFLRYLEEREAQLRKTFDSIDVNKNGFITLEELQIARSSHIIQGSDADLAALITWMDSMDGDEAKNDRVDFEEFKTSLTLLPPSTTLSNVIDLMRKHGHTMIK